MRSSLVIGFVIVNALVVSMAAAAQSPLTATVVPPGWERGVAPGAQLSLTFASGTRWPVDRWEGLPDKDSGVAAILGPGFLQDVSAQIVVQLKTMEAPDVAGLGADAQRLPGQYGFTGPSEVGVACGLPAQIMTRNQKGTAVIPRSRERADGSTERYFEKVPVTVEKSHYWLATGAFQPGTRKQVFASVFLDVEARDDADKLASTRDALESIVKGLRFETGGRMLLEVEVDPTRPLSRCDEGGPLEFTVRLFDPVTEAPVSPPPGSLLRLHVWDREYNVFKLQEHCLLNRTRVSRSQWRKDVASLSEGAPPSGPIESLWTIPADPAAPSAVGTADIGTRPSAEELDRRQQVWRDDAMVLQRGSLPVEVPASPTLTVQLFLDFGKLVYYGDSVLREGGVHLPSLETPLDVRLSVELVEPPAKEGAKETVLARASATSHVDAVATVRATMFQTAKLRFRRGLTSQTTDVRRYDLDEPVVKGEPHRDKLGTRRLRVDRRGSDPQAWYLNAPGDPPGDAARPGQPLRVGDRVHVLAEGLSTHGFSGNPLDQGREGPERLAQGQLELWIDYLDGAFCKFVVLEDAGHVTLDVGASADASGFSNPNLRFGYAVGRYMGKEAAKGLVLAAVTTLFPVAAPVTGAYSVLDNGGDVLDGLSWIFRSDEIRHIRVRSSFVAAFQPGGGVSLLTSEGQPSLHTGPSDRSGTVVPKDSLGFLSPDGRATVRPATPDEMNQSRAVLSTDPAPSAPTPAPPQTSAPPTVTAPAQPSSEQLFPSATADAWQPYEADGGRFALHARTSVTGLVVDVPPDNDWGKAGIRSRSPVFTTGPQLNENPVSIDCDFDPSTTTGFVIALSGETKKDVWQAPNLWFVWTRDSYGIEGRYDVGNCRATTPGLWRSEHTGPRAPARVSLVVRGSEVQVIPSNGPPSTTTLDWLAKPDEPVYLHVFTHPRAARLPCAMTLTAVTIHRGHESAAQAASVTPPSQDPVSTVAFRGTLEDMWRPHACVGGNFDTFARPSPAGLSVRVRAHSSWGTTGIQSRYPIFWTGAKGHDRSIRVDVAVDGQATTGYVLALSPTPALGVSSIENVWMSAVLEPDGRGPKLTMENTQSPSDTRTGATLTGGQPDRLSVQILNGRVVARWGSAAPIEGTYAWLRRPNQPVYLSVFSRPTAEHQPSSLLLTWIALSR